MKIDKTKLEDKDVETFSLEKGDFFKCLKDKVYTKPFEYVEDGIKKKGMNYGIAAQWDKKEIFLKLTQGQAKELSKHEPLTGKEFGAYEYTNSFGVQIAVGEKAK